MSNDVIAMFHNAKITIICQIKYKKWFFQRIKNIKYNVAYMC